MKRKRVWPGLALLLLLGPRPVGAAAQSAWPPFLGPREAFPDDVVTAVEHVWLDPTLSRTVRGRSAHVPFEVYVAFVDTPEVTAAAARFRDLAPYGVEALDDDRYRADDGSGAHGVYRVLVRDATRRVILSQGEHSGSILGAIRGSALTVLVLEPRGDVVDQLLTAYVRIDNVVAAALARLLVPIFGYIADRKLAEGFTVAAKVAEWAVQSPAEFCDWLGRTPLEPERRGRMRAVLPACR